MIIVKLVSIVVIGYLLGSIPFGLLISRRFSKVDIRNHGSGKIGTTNVLRTTGKKAAILALVLDASIIGQCSLSFREGGVLPPSSAG